MSEIFLHHCRGIATEFVNVDLDAITAEEFCSKHGNSESEFRIWLQDAENPIDTDEVLSKAGVTERCHIIMTSCREIAVTIQQSGNRKEFHVAPSSTLQRIFEQATGENGFALTDDQRVNHELLQVTVEGTVNLEDHIGTIAGEDCTVILELCPKERFEG